MSDELRWAGLQKKLETRLVELTELLDEARRTDEPVAPDKAIGRLTRQDALSQQQMAAELRRRNEQERVRVENALRAMREGTYGVCQRCEDPIAPARLAAMPYASLCVQCADKPAGPR